MEKHCLDYSGNKFYLIINFYLIYFFKLNKSDI